MGAQDALKPGAGLRMAAHDRSFSRIRLELHPDGTPGLKGVSEQAQVFRLRIDDRAPHVPGVPSPADFDARR